MNKAQLGKLYEKKSDLTVFFSSFGPVIQKQFVYVPNLDFVSQV